MDQLTNWAETRLKAAVIDRLIDKAHVDDDAVLVSEMTVANWSRRADVVLANGSLWGFEIKSEVDSLSRLPGQISTFLSHFEKLTIVAAERYSVAVQRMLPDGVGLWIMTADGLKEKLRPRYRALEPEAAIGLMTASELRTLMMCNGHSALSSATRAHLEDMAIKLPNGDLASAARDAVKRRHRQRHSDFLRHRLTLGTLASIPSLRRRSSPTPALQRVCSTAPTVPCEQWEPEASHPLLVHAPAGPVLRRQTG
jgi:hypothetical protein